MTSHEEQRAALAKEREGRLAAFLAATEKRNEVAAFANANDATDFDRRELSRAEARVEMARTAMRHWKDPMPEAAIDSTARQGECSLSRPASAVETAEAVAARILAADTVPGEGNKDISVDVIAARILKS